MDDYISRKAVLSKCQQIWSNADETTEIGVAIINIVDELADFVENIPSADVQPVKHGRWIDNGMVYTCSECNSSVPKNIFVIGCDFEGCPYCFARMDGDSE